MTDTYLKVTYWKDTGKIALINPFVDPIDVEECYCSTLNITMYKIKPKGAKNWLSEKVHASNILFPDNAFYWTYERDGKIFDAEFETKMMADEYAQECFMEECIDDGIEHNETREEEYYLIYFSYDDDGDRVIDERERAFLEYTGYHGDLKEHGTW